MYPQLQPQLFQNNYTSFVSFKSKPEELFLIPHGYCKTIFKPDTKEEIRTREKSIFFVVDQARVSRMRIKEMDNGRIDFGPTDELAGYFGYAAYEIEYRLHDSSIYDGVNCMNYENLNSSYGVCIEEIIKKNFLDVLGCLPPWFPQKVILQFSYLTGYK